MLSWRSEKRRERESRSEIHRLCLDQLLWRLWPSEARNRTKRSTSYPASSSSASPGSGWPTVREKRPRSRCLGKLDDFWRSPHHETRPVAVLNAVLRSVLKNVHVTNKVLFYAMANVVLFVVK